MISMVVYKTWNLQEENFEKKQIFPLCLNAISIIINRKANYLYQLGGELYDFRKLPPNDWCPRGRTAYLGNMFTSRDYRRKGLASQILNLLVQKAKSKKCERILLNTNDMGKELYKKMGFDFSSTAMALYPFGIINEYD